MVLTLGAELHSVNAAAPSLVRVASGHVPSPRHRPRCTHSEADPLRLADGSVRGKLHPPDAAVRTGRPCPRALRVIDRRWPRPARRRPRTARLHDRAAPDLRPPPPGNRRARPLGPPAPVPRRAPGGSNALLTPPPTTEARRVGKECVTTYKSR